MKTKTAFPEVVHLHNLIPDPEISDSYIPLGDPAPVCGEGFSLLCALADGTAVVSSVDGTYILNPGTGATTALGSERGLCAAVLSDGCLLIMTSDGPRRFAKNNEGLYVCSDTNSVWAPVSIVAEPMAPLSFDTDGLILSREYQPGDRLVAADRKLVAMHVNEAYRQLVNRAHSMGVFLQPLLARAVMADKSGNIVHRGPTILVMPPEGVPLDDGISLDMATPSTIVPSSVSVPSFRLKIVTHPEAGYSENGLSLRIEILSPFQPLVDDISQGVIDVSVVRKGTSSVALRTTLPGAAKGLNTANPDKNRRLILDALAAFDTEAITTATFSEPLRPEFEEDVAAYGVSSEGQKNRAVSMKTRSYMPHFVNAPHSFTAQHMCATPLAVAYGDIKPLYFPGYSPADYASAIDTHSKPWTAVTTVLFDDGSKGIRVSKGCSCRPVSLVPLLSYPHPNARSIEIIIKSETPGSAAERWYADLTPDASGRYAIGLVSSLSVRTPERHDFPWPDAAANVRPNPELTNAHPDAPGRSNVLVARNDTPSVITAGTEAVDTVRAVIAASSTSGAWDYGRTRFLAFTGDRTLLLNVAADFGTVAAGNIASVGVNDKGCIAVGGDGTPYFIDSAGFVYRVNGSRVSVLTKLHGSENRLGFDTSSGLLVAADDSGEGYLHHLNVTTGKTVLTSSALGPFERMLTVGTHLLMNSESGLFDIARDHRVKNAPSSYVEMVCTSTFSAAVGLRRVCRTTWDVCASVFEGSFTVSRYSLSNREAPVCGISVSGRINTPVVLPHISRPLAGLRLAVKGRVSADMHLSVPSFSYAQS